MNRVIILLLITVFSSACVKDPGFENSPHIYYNSIKRYEFFDQGTLTSEEFVDVTLGFEDGDGDLGELNSSSESNLFYQTYRRSLTKDSLIVDWTEFRFNNLAPEENYVGPLSGDFTVSIKYLSTDTTFRNNDTIFYKIEVVDRSGNKSNIAETGTVVIFPN